MSIDSKKSESMFTDVSTEKTNTGQEVEDMLAQYRNMTYASTQNVPLSLNKEEEQKKEGCNITSTCDKKEKKQQKKQQKTKPEKKHANRGKKIVSTLVAFSMMTVGAGSYYLSKKTMDGQLNSFITHSNVIMPYITGEFTHKAEEMKIGLDENETVQDAFNELDNYLKTTKEIMSLRDFETVIKTAQPSEVMLKFHKSREDKFSTIKKLTGFDEAIQTYNQHKNVDITDYSIEALEKTQAIDTIAVVYSFCKDYFKSGKATDCLSAGIYLACSSFCGNQLGLEPSETINHTVEVVEAQEEGKKDKTYMFYGNQKVELSSTITKQIYNIELLNDTILTQGAAYTITEQDLDTMYDAYNTAKKIVFTEPGESCYEAQIKNGKTLVLRPNVATIAKKTIDSIK